MTTQQQDNTILFPPGRVVQGDLYEAQDTDMQGNKLTNKSGPNIGKERVNYFFSIAIPKAGEQAWWHTPWGAKAYTLARSWWPALFDAQGNCLHRNFAWKISDGDDTAPNPDAQMKRNCDREGFPGNWIVRFSSGYATRIVDVNGQPLLTPGLVKRGYWVEVYATIANNEQTSKPGIYMNHNVVSYRAPGKEIVSGPDPRSLGFGRAALPPGVTEQPVGNVANMPSTVVPPSLPPPPAAPGYSVPSAVPGAVAAHVPQTPASVPTPVQPHQGFLAPPVPGAAVPAVPAAPSVPAVPSFVDPLGAPTGYKMTNPAGATYAAMVKGGWTDALLVQHGHMVRL